MTDLKQRPKGDTLILWKLETLQVAATNLSTVAIVFALWGSLFVLVSFVFGVTYKTLKNKNETFNLFYFIVLNFVEPICFQIAQFIIIYNSVRPTPNNAPLGRAFSVMKNPQHPFRTLSSVRVSSARVSRISSTRIEQDTRSSMTQPASIVPKSYLLSPPETCSRPTSSVSSNPINTDSSNILLQPVHPRNRLSKNLDTISNACENLDTISNACENLDTISNASTSYYSIGENFITSSRNNSPTDFNQKETNSQRTSSQLSGHSHSINEHLNNSDSVQPLQQSHRLSNTSLSTPLNYSREDEL
ncbi:782_t:CDS:2 [Cetraspora pellucida]|uniref:782_t:CDS:1 n=1 Tax=Cetraspora pellucida TaxID=1433469 RepID=A0A9N9IR16_9GLOM|nr:782_t:CDS:2 [Cetraspora pellucida]